MKQPSKRKLMHAVRSTAKIMQTISKSSLPVSRHIRRFLREHAAWLEKQLKP